MSTYPAGYIEQLARPFKVRDSRSNERPHPQQREGAGAANLAASADTQAARR